MLYELAMESWQDDEASSEGRGWYARFKGPIELPADSSFHDEELNKLGVAEINEELREYAGGAILHERDDGHTYSEFYKTQKEADTAWAGIEEDMAPPVWKVVVGVHEDDSDEDLPEDQGTVFEGDEEDARYSYKEYCKRSDSDNDPVSGEEVFLQAGDDVIKQHEGKGKSSKALSDELHEARSHTKTGRHPKYSHLVMFEIEPHHGSYILTAQHNPGSALISSDDAQEMFGDRFDDEFAYLTDEYLSLLRDDDDDDDAEETERMPDSGREDFHSDG
jgi:hypothetical protein